MNSDSCIFCGNSTKETLLSKNPYTEFINVSCKVCGNYIIDSDFKEDFPSYKNIDDQWKISAYIKEKNLINIIPFILYESENSNIKNGITYTKAIASFPKDINEKIDRILINLSKKTYEGQWFPLNHNYDYPLFFTPKGKEDSFKFICDVFVENGYFEKEDTQLRNNYRLKAKAWERIGLLNKSINSNLKNVFVAMWFNDEVNSVYDDTISTVISDLGYNPIRIDRKEHNGKIDDEIIAEIRKSKFVICDFTGNRGGVYFEAGFAMGLGKPVIWTCKKDHIDDLHFDTRQYNHIVWETKDDLYRALKNRIEATIV